MIVVNFIQNALIWGVCGFDGRIFAEIPGVALIWSHSFIGLDPCAVIWGMRYCFLCAVFNSSGFQQRMSGEGEEGWLNLMIYFFKNDGGCH